MKTNVTFRHLKSNQDLHDAAIEHANGFEKFHENIFSTDVVFKDDQEKIVEFAVRVHGSTLVAKESSDDFTKSLNTAADKIVRQLRKWKTKRFSK